MSEQQPATLTLARIDLRLTLTLSLDLQGKRTGDFHTGAAWLQLLMVRSNAILRLRIPGFSDWLEVEHSRSVDSGQEGNLQQGAHVPIEIVLRDSATGKTRGRRTVYVTSEFVDALRTAPDASSVPMVEMAVSRPAPGEWG